MSQRFASEIDTWLVVLGFGVTAISVLSIAPLFFVNIDLTVKIVTGGLSLLAIALFAWVYLGTYYIVDSNILSIRSGPFHWQIQISEIHRVSPTRSPWSSPALSLNRLRIEYGEGKWILVSPKHRDEFIRSLGMSLA